MDCLYLLVKQCHGMRVHLLSIILQQISFFRKNILHFFLNDVRLHLHISYIWQPKFQYYYEILYHTFSLMVCIQYFHLGTLILLSFFNSNVYFDIKNTDLQKVRFFGLTFWGRYIFFYIISTSFLYCSFIFSSSLSSLINCC